MKWGSIVSLPLVFLAAFPALAAPPDGRTDEKPASEAADDKEKKPYRKNKKKPPAAHRNPAAFAQGVVLEPIDVSGANWSIGALPGGLVGSAIARPAFEEMPIGLRVEDIVKRLPGITTGGATGEDKDGRGLGIDKEFTLVSGAGF